MKPSPLLVRNRTLPLQLRIFATLFVVIYACVYGVLNADTFLLGISVDPIINVALSMAAMILAALTMFPAELVAISNGAVYGPVAGFFLTWIAALIGASLGFGIARLLGRTSVSRFVGAKRLTQLDGWIDKYGLGMLLLVRIIPVIPFFVINYGAGLTKLRYRSYLIVTAISITPMTALCVVLGDRVIEQDLTGIYVALTIAGILVAAGIWLRKARFQRAN